MATPENISLLSVGNYLWKNDDEECGIIERLEMSVIDEEIIIVGGRFVTSILARRIIWGTEVLSGDAGENVGNLLNRHIRLPSDAARRVDHIDYLDWTADYDLGQTVTAISKKRVLFSTPVLQK
jgi:hypothetical protein